jgi:penicillin-binding protein A
MSRQWNGYFLAVLGIALGLAGFQFFDRRPGGHPRRPVSTSPISREAIAAAIEPSLNEDNELPDELEIKTPRKIYTLAPKYTIDEVVQDRMLKLFKSYRPDYGAFVALDPVSGRILALVSYTRNASTLGNLALKASFPSASTFKIVTAAAALDQHKADADTVISFNGGYHTLYRRNLTQNTENRWTRHMTLREAFAKSINTVFGKLGWYLDPLQLDGYARKFLFNQKIDTDVPVESGTFLSPSKDQFAVAEAASGFNRVALMSPLQGALMASAAANDGVIMKPYIVDSLLSSEGELVYHAQAKQADVALSPEAAEALRNLMHETVWSGTSRGAFRTLWRIKELAGLEIGGKTGSLQGTIPKGKCDWFVGYALSPERKVAVAALTVNETNWRVKSSYLARYFIENYFRAPRPSRTLARRR